MRNPDAVHEHLCTGWVAEDKHFALSASPFRIFFESLINERSSFDVLSSWCGKKSRCGRPANVKGRAFLVSLGSQEMAVEF